jgi:hypothetical protein
MAPKESKEYIFTESFSLDKKDSIELFTNKIKNDLGTLMLKDNFFINKNRRGEDYLEDIIPTRIKKLDTKEEDFLLNIIDKYKIPVVNSGVHISASFRILDDQNSIFSALYKKTFLGSYSIDVFDNEAVIEEINNFTKEREEVNKIHYSLVKNRQTYSSDFSLQNYLNFLDTVFPIIQLM